jgi:vacuolar protein sorting-associated protein 13A/C
VDGLQVDNQLPLTPMPVLFTTQDAGNKPEFLLKLTATTNDQGMADYYSYPYIGIQVGVNFKHFYLLLML